MTCRIMSLCCRFLLVGVVLGTHARAEADDWTDYRQRHVTTDGRVIDNGNGNISHSEGQGFAMLLASYHDDPDHFARIWGWTRRHLGIREDGLFAWRWEPNDEGGAVTDRNNASDADLLIAWALARGGRLWQRPDYIDAASRIANAIRSHLIHPSLDGPLLLPGREGFIKEESLVLNLSYWVFPAFTELQHIDPSPQWKELRDSGLKLLTRARFGRWQLPPDWLTYGAEPAPAGDPFRPRFGYDAVRIPLYLNWAGLGTPEQLAPFRGFWEHFNGVGFTPAWTDLRDDSIDSYDAAPGIQAIVHLTRSGHSAELPTLDDGQDYYSASLLLLTRAARTEMRP